MFVIAVYFIRRFRHLSKRINYGQGTFTYYFYYFLQRFLPVLLSFKVVRRERLIRRERLVVALPSRTNWRGSWRRPPPRRERDAQRPAQDGRGARRARGERRRRRPRRRPRRVGLARRRAGRARGVVARARNWWSGDGKQPRRSPRCRRVAGTVGTRGRPRGPGAEPPTSGSYSELPLSGSYAVVRPEWRNCGLFDCFVNRPADPFHHPLSLRSADARGRESTQTLRPVNPERKVLSSTLHGPFGCARRWEPLYPLPRHFRVREEEEERGVVCFSYPELSLLK